MESRELLIQYFTLSFIPPLDKKNEKTNRVKTVRLNTNLVSYHYLFHISHMGMPLSCRQKDAI